MAGAGVEDRPQQSPQRQSIFMASVLHASIEEGLCLSTGPGPLPAFPCFHEPKQDLCNLSQPGTLTKQSIPPPSATPLFDLPPGDTGQEEGKGLRRAAGSVGELSYL